MIGLRGCNDCYLYGIGSRTMDVEGSVFKFILCTTDYRICGPKCIASIWRSVRIDKQVLLSERLCVIIYSFREDSITPRNLVRNYLNATPCVQCGQLRP